MLGIITFGLIVLMAYPLFKVIGHIISQQKLDETLKPNPSYKEVLQAATSRSRSVKEAQRTQGFYSLPHPNLCQAQDLLYPTLLNTWLTPNEISKLKALEDWRLNYKRVYAIIDVVRQRQQEAHAPALERVA